MINRRCFFGAVAGLAATPALALASASPTFAPITRAERVIVCCDLSVSSILDAAGNIHRIARRAPSAYRLTTGPWLYLDGRSTDIKDAMRKEYQADIVVVMDGAITDYQYWSLDALGVKIWSPGGA